MKKVIGFLMVVGTLTGCSYGGVAVNAAGDKAVVVRNDSFLLGALRKAYVCKVADSGLSNCQNSDSP